MLAGINITIYQKFVESHASSGSKCRIEYDSYIRSNQEGIQDGEETIALMFQGKSSLILHKRRVRTGLAHSVEKCFRV